eukprot:2424584-Rhodomonas_salina.1
MLEVHCEIKYKKAQSQYSLYQECAHLYLISGCSIADCLYIAAVPIIEEADLSMCYDATGHPVLSIAYSLCGARYVTSGVLVPGGWRETESDSDEFDFEFGQIHRKRHDYRA